MYKSMIEARKPNKVVARAFKGPDGQWGVRPGAGVSGLAKDDRQQGNQIGVVHVNEEVVVAGADEPPSPHVAHHAIATSEFR